MSKSLTDHVRLEAERNLLGAISHYVEVLISDAMDARELAVEEPQQGTLGGRLRQARKLAGLSGEAAGHALNTTRAAVSRWETGACSASVEQIARLASLYGVRAEWLAFGTGVMVSPLAGMGDE
jgi:DNA-binding transcriptional regulator YiaG